MRNPEDDKSSNLRTHCGSHPEILEKVLNHDHQADKMRDKRKFLEDQKRHGRRKTLLLDVCTSGRHRGEAEKILTSGALELAGAELDSCSSLCETIWRERGCRWRTCAECQHEGKSMASYFKRAYELFRPRKREEEPARDRILRR